MCGIFGIYPHKDAARLTYLGLYALQHRGEEAAGIVSSNGKKIFLHKALGLVSDVFNEEIIHDLRVELAVGHVRYSTTGSSNVKNVQPFLVKSKNGNIAIAHNGNLINALGLRKELEEKGAFSLVLMFNDILIGCRDTFGWRPLCLGKLDGAYILASETCALDLIGAQYIRDVEPGEILFIHKDKIESLKPFPKTRCAFCIFEYIYFSRPDSNIFGHNVYLARKKLGEQLAKEFPVEADLVMPIPDSGTYAALGFSKACGIPYDLGMIRNHYIGRTFIQPSQIVRDFRVKVKLNAVKEVLRGRRVAVIEDSIVRGTTSRARVKTLREAGAKQVHMRISCPPLRFPCFYGIDFPTRKELIAAKHSIDWIREFIGVDTLEYLSLEGMLNSMPLPKENFCTACYTGNYPLKPSSRLY